VQGVARDISPKSSSFLVCYCVDCQAYSRFLGRDGLLDAYGGTTVLVAAPADLTITKGSEQLACVRLSDKGMFRWYTKCCRTPVGNLPGSPLLAMTTVPAAFVDRARAEIAPEQLLGKPVGIMGRGAPGGLPAGAHAALPAGLLASMLWLILRATFAGRTKPSPFLDPQTQRPWVKAQVLAKEERAALG
jgi:hypothetical protein